MPPNEAKMIVKLDEKWRITTDPHNWRLERNAKKTWTVVGYYPTLGSALQAYYDNKLRASPLVGDLSDAIREARKLFSHIQAQLDQEFRIK